MNPSQLIAAATSKYNNIVSKEDSKIFKESKKKQDKETNDTKFIALLTSLLLVLTTALTTQGTIASGNTSRTNSIRSLEPWRKVNVGPTVEKNGKTWYWCSKHTKEGDYDGLYVTHHPDQHDEIMSRCAKVKREKVKTSPPVSQNNDGLTLNNDIKASLTTSDLTAITTAIQALESKARARE